MTNSQIDKKGRIGFVDLVLNVFAFLANLKFRIVRRTATFVRFENNVVFINIYHGRSSYQVGLEIGRIGFSELYSFYEVLNCVAPDETDRARCQALTYDVLERCLTDIASILTQQCQNLLLGDDKAFQALRLTAFDLRKKATLQAQFGGKIDRADKAWEAKEYNKAAELYKAAEPALDKTRRKRLTYLNKKMLGIQQ
jgi:hypothetical protein